MESSKPASDNYAIQAQFMHNASNLAAWKAHRMATDIATLDSEDDIRNAIKRYNQWQAVEYNAITSRARTARQMLNFEKSSHVYPNLRWIRSRSANPRELHLTLVGLVLPKDDPFWQRNQPGSLYGCKCDWEQTDDTPAQTTPKDVPASAGLEGNPLNHGQLITRKAGHFKAQENKVVRNAIFNVLGDEAWMDFGNIKAHLLQKPHEVKNNVKASMAYLRADSTVNEILLLPDYFEDQLHHRDKIVPAGQRIGKGKQPDAVVVYKNGVRLVTELKYLPGQGKYISGHIKDAGKTCDHAVVVLGENNTLNDDQLKGEATYAVAKGYIKKVTIIKNDGTKITAP